MSVGSSLPESTEMTPSDVEIPTRVQELPKEPTTIVETPPQTEPEDVTVTEMPQVNTEKNTRNVFVNKLSGMTPHFCDRLSEL